MKEKDKVVIFGGAFNPPLNSHFSLAEQIVNEYDDILKVVFVPVNNLYEKADLLGNEHRYNMLNLVCSKNPCFEVSRVELDNDRPLYTIETLNILQEKYPKKQLYLLWAVII